LIPVDSESIQITLTQGGATVGQALIARPTNGATATTTFASVPVGTVQVAAVALPNADGSGVAQAVAQTTVSVIADQTTTIPLTLASTIDHLNISPPAPVLGAGESEALTATAVDASGEIVLTSPSTITWSSDNTATATVGSGSGLIQWQSAGTANITATETESGKTGTAAVTLGTPAPMIYEGFDYPAGSPILNQTGGTGWTGGWGEYGQGYSPSVIVANSLAYGNLTVSGNALELTGYNPVGEDRAPASPVGTDGQVLYVSALMEPLAVTGGNLGGSYFSIGFSDMLLGKSGSTSTYCIEKPTGDISDTGIPAVANQTVFLVARITFQPGPDRVELWVNPIPGQPLPAPNAVKTDADVSNPSNLGIGGNVPCFVDEYRYGPTWASVSPTTP
jgi:hypothetical protein